LPEKRQVQRKQYTNGNSYIKNSVRITSDLVVNFTQQDKVREGFFDKLRNVWDYLFGN
jgi:hypothetical protein